MTFYDKLDIKLSIIKLSKLANHNIMNKIADKYMEIQGYWKYDENFKFDYTLNPITFDISDEIYNMKKKFKYSDEKDAKLIIQYIFNELINNEDYFNYLLENKSYPISKGTVTASYINRGGLISLDVYIDDKKYIRPIFHIKSKKIKFCQNRIKYFGKYFNNEHHKNCYLQSHCEYGPCICGLEEKQNYFLKNIYNSNYNHKYFKIFQKSTNIYDYTTGNILDECEESMIDFMKFSINNMMDETQNETQNESDKFISYLDRLILDINIYRELMIRRNKFIETGEEHDGEIDDEIDWRPIDKKCVNSLRKNV